MKLHGLIPPMTAARAAMTADLMDELAVEFGPDTVLGVEYQALADTARDKAHALRLEEMGERGIRATDDLDYLAGLSDRFHHCHAPEGQVAS